MSPTTEFTTEHPTPTAQPTHTAIFQYIVAYKRQHDGLAPDVGSIGQHTKGLEAALASKSAECERLRRQLYKAQQRAGGQRAMIAQQKRIDDLEAENERLRASLATAITAWKQYQFRAQAFEQRPN